MIDPTMGMKSGERYRVEHVERVHPFTGLFQDGNHYLGPELLTRLANLNGWLTRRGIDRSQAAAACDGNLFEPPSRARGVQDGWRSDRSPASSRMAVTALVLLSGCALAMLCRKRR